jgi:hypothetical protein
VSAVVEPGTRARRPGLAGFAALNALAAWAGALGLVTGGTDFGERINERLPFQSLVLAGLALATIVAIPLTMLAWSAWAGSPRTNDIALVVGLMLIGWIIGQIVVLWAFSLFQPAYLCIGASFVAASHRVRLRPTSRRILVSGPARPNESRSGTSTEPTTPAGTTHSHSSGNSVSSISSTRA